MKAGRARRVLLAARSSGSAAKLLLVGLAVLLGTGGAITAALAAQPAKPGLTLQTSPASQSVTRGQSAVYTVSGTSTGGFSGSVALSASGLPGGAAAAFSPVSITLASSGTGATGTSTATVSTSAATPVGSYTLTFTGTSGKISGSVTIGLTVNYPLSSALTVTAAPSSVSMSPGSTAVYTVALTRTNLTNPVTFSVFSGLPSGATATYSPNPTTGNSSSLQVATTASTADGTYTLNLVASGTDSAGTTRYAYASVQLVITTSGKPFTISGDVSGLLAPGVSRSLDLTLNNPNKKSLSITNLTVTVQSVTRATGVSGPCTTADYQVTQYSGPYPLTVAGNGTASLSSLGAASQYWPKVKMLDTATNQDGCKGASLTLAYSGSGQGN
jgi:hypothetical protein